MGILKLPIGTEGPIVGVSLSAGKQRKPARLLIDTGSTATIVEADIVAGLGIAPTDLVWLDGHGGRQQAHRYDVAIYLNDRLWVRSLPILAVPRRVYAVRGINGVLGRDVLASTVLIYDGSTGTFTLSF